MPWPSSIPDYRWPLAARSLRAGPRRWGLAALFHISHAWGRCISLFFRQRPAVLMIRTDGLGDAVLAEPMMASLARQFPGRKFILWAPAATCDLMRECPYVARRMEIPRGYKQGNLEVFQSARWRMVMGYRLGRWKFEVSAYLTQSPEPLGNWVLVSARARERWYCPGNTENQFAEQQGRTVNAADKVLSPLPAGHELARNAHLAEQWGDDIGGRLPVVFPADGVDEQWNVWTQTTGELGASRIVGLVASGMEAMKEYPHRHWAAVAARLWDEERVVLALIGGPGDTTNLDRLGSAIGGLHLRLTAPMLIPSLAALIGRLDGFFSVDTGLAQHRARSECAERDFVRGRASEAIFALAGGAAGGGFEPFDAVRGVHESVHPADGGVRDAHSAGADRRSVDEFGRASAERGRGLRSFV